MPSDEKDPGFYKGGARPEEEHEGSIWSHPYMIYILLTAVLFTVLLVIAGLALKYGWIPDRGAVR